MATRTKTDRSIPLPFALGPLVKNARGSAIGANPVDLDDDILDVGADGKPVRGAVAMFDFWASVAQSRPSRALGERSVRHYRSTWNGWITWLSPRCKWHKATPDQVSAYLAQVSQSATARRRNASVGQASTVTRRRYWRVLRDVYRDALLAGHISENPCLDAAEVPKTEAMDSMILTPQDLRKIEDGIVLDHSKLVNADWRQLRDDAIMMLLLSAAAKTGELVTLQAQDVIRAFSEINGPHFVVHLRGPRPAQNRHIPIHNLQAQNILRHWLEAREAMPTASEKLFFGAKTHLVDGERKCRDLTPKSVFLLVASMVAKHLGEPLAHAGAEAIRNSVIALWVTQKMDPEDIMKRAGMAELRAVYRLDRENKITPP